MFGAAVAAAAQAHALRVYPEESCGLVVDGTYAEVENQFAGTAKAKEAWGFDERLIVGLGGRLGAVIHSHPDHWPVPSAADMRQQQAMALPWGIVGVGKDPDRPSSEEIAASPVTWFGASAPKQPVMSAAGIGRGFIHGVQDCFSAILDWHRTRGIDHPEWPRDWEWWLPKGDDLPAEDLYRAHFEEMGCVAIDGPRPGAVFFACIGRDAEGEPIYRPNHGGVYLGNELILHHRTTQKPIDPTRLARREPIGIIARASNAPLQWVVHRDMTDSLARA
jgi:proteasome lid subunit RPN8/RPN11